MADVYLPQDETELSRFIASAYAKLEPIEVCGFRSKRAAGRPFSISVKTAVSTADLCGITLYEPNELVISARAGTPLHEIELALAEKNQELAFEPVLLSRVFSTEYLAATIGGVVAMNISGPRRVLRGAARDYLLGLKAINGQGEIIKSGGRVMKNVTGVDLVRGLCGSWGTLGVITDVTLKVLPKAPECRTIAFVGLSDEAAVGVMSASLGTPYEVSGTLHLHSAFVSRLKDQALAPMGTPLTVLRIEGAGARLKEKAQLLRKELAPFGETFELSHERSVALWNDVRALSFLSGNFDNPLWRITIAPSKAPLVVRALSVFFPVKAAYEWSGGLIWLETPVSTDASVTEVRRVLGYYNADAMLMRGSRNIRADIEAFHPLPLAKMKLVQEIKKAFDPAGILNPGRLWAGV